MNPILEIDQVSKSFGGLGAVDSLCLEVHPGRITSLIGGNGAGKTTAFNLITGYLKPDAGEIRYKGQRIDGLAPHLIARKGISRGFQELRLFNRLTALDNLETAVPGQKGESIWHAILGSQQLKTEASLVKTKARQILQNLTISRQADSFAELLSYGQQKLVALGRMMAAEGEFLLFDEPTSGLSPAMVDDFCDRMQQLVRQGRTILLIEHNVEIVMRLSDWIIVLHQGKKIAEGHPQDIQKNESVMNTYLGIGA
jgi:ABC-type branched-subunit amino acid transport system ATPase component